MLKVVKLTPLVKDKGYELSLIGESKVEDKPAVGVLVKSKDHNDVSLFFDKETGLLAKLEHRTTDPTSGKEVTEERIIVSYGDKGEKGVLLPKEVAHQARRGGVPEGRGDGGDRPGEPGRQHVQEVTGRAGGASRCGTVRRPCRNRHPSFTPRRAGGEG